MLDFNYNYTMTYDNLTISNDNKSTTLQEEETEKPIDIVLLLSTVIASVGIVANLNRSCCFCKS